jgi:hypothetical protein
LAEHFETDGGTGGLIALDVDVRLECPEVLAVGLFLQQFVEQGQRVVVVGASDGALDQAEPKLEVLRLEDQGLAIGCLRRHVPAEGQIDVAQQPEHLAVTASQFDRPHQGTHGGGELAVADEGEAEVLVGAPVVGELHKGGLEELDGIG